MLATLCWVRVFIFETLFPSGRCVRCRGAHEHTRTLGPVSHHHIHLWGSDGSMAPSLPFYWDHLLVMSLPAPHSGWPWSSGPWLRLRQREGLETLGFSIPTAGLSFPSVQRKSRAVPGLHVIHASPRT